MARRSASDVASGLEAFRRYSPDIVLIDYHMPGVSGIEGVKLLRKQSASVPIIVFTIDESQTVADTFLAAGASDFALKPIKAPDIVSRIRLHLRLAGQNQPEPAASKGISGGTLGIIMSFLSGQSDYVTETRSPKGQALRIRRSIAICSIWCRIRRWSAWTCMARWDDRSRSFASCEQKKRDAVFG